MKNQSLRDWMQAVSEVFDTNPRNGNREATVWLRRRELERQLEAELFTGGRHICIDGCSGSGKSSLVITILLRHQHPFTTVQISRKMDWHGFCRELISRPKRRNLRASGSAEWRDVLPTAKFEFSLGDKTQEALSLELWEKNVAAATEHDIARAIAEQNCVVLLDEFERAQPDLANSISEVCKIMSQTYRSKFGKFVILGADDVYKKLYDAYSTLDSRLVHINIPTLPGPTNSWEYLTMGFRKLGKSYPRSGQSPSERAAVVEAMQCVYGAANGLFKTLTELGVELCKATGPSNREISLSIIRRVCAEMESNNFAKYRNQFSKFHALSSSNPAIAAILLYISSHGLGKVHDREDIYESLSNLGRGLVEDGILALWKNEFLVMTGASNEKIFVKNPSWAHTLRIYLSEPRKRRKLEAHLSGPIQFGLELGVDWDSIETDPTNEHIDANIDGHEKS